MHLVTITVVTSRQISGPRWVLPCFLTLRAHLLSGPGPWSSAWFCQPAFACSHHPAQTRRLGVGQSQLPAASLALPVSSDPVSWPLSSAHLPNTGSCDGLCAYPGSWVSAVQPLGPWLCSQTGLSSELHLSPCLVSHAPRVSLGCP